MLNKPILIFTFIIWNVTISIAQIYSAPILKIHSNIENVVKGKMSSDFFDSLEFYSQVKFDLDELIKKHEVPKILNEDWAVAFNQESFSTLKNRSDKNKIKFSVYYTYLIREAIGDAWSPMWALVFIGENGKVIDFINIYP